ncbi:unnamed protein product [Linum tenue]|uniref:GIR1-like zinc ribbon domain-containing protein n=1 Tax=Linum tenue TaxID=586396 RepID=A0AAV0MVT3_9ROSI|nr:unnamed protein product [Linum tenue]
MAADVSYLIRGMSAYKDDRAVGGGEPSLITRDLLGGGSSSSAVGGSECNEFQELDLDVQVPTGWEKRLDLKSGKVYLHRSNASSASPSSSSSSDHRHHHNLSQAFPKLQDLNFPPSSSRITLNLFEESSLELRLAAAASTSSSSLNYQSVCTLDKVKSALERAERDSVHSTAAAIRKRFPAGKSSLSPSYSSSSSSVRELAAGEEETEERAGAASASSPVAAGCPGCLSYVLIMKNNPKCPRCNSVVPMPPMKKQRIDLNISI